MRIDDIAYQRATRVAGMGLALQLVFGLVLLVFGVLARDTTFVVGSCYVLVGSLVWLTLVLVFNQHRLERIEALETDELQQQRMAGLGSAFETEDEQFNVAARRLRLMYKWLVPIVSWAIIILLSAFALFWQGYIRLTTVTDYSPTGGEGHGFVVVSDEMRGWGLALCLGMAAIYFICSRFVSGMSKQPAWQNLRGGAGYMVGNAMVLLAIAVGIVFTYFDNQTVMEYIALGLCGFMAVFAGETLLNFILNLYRPRRPGEVPRPAFDSRLLSLLSAPDSIVRSINEAVNYQFGFDISSSWGYRLLTRAVTRLSLFAVVVIILLNCVVIVEPHQQGVVLQGGEIHRIAGPGPMFKMPWPIQSAEVYDVTRTRHLDVTTQIREDRQNRNAPLLWTDDIDQTLGIEPFIVSARRTEVPALRIRTTDPDEAPLLLLEDEAESDTPEALLSQVDKNFGLIETAFVLSYRLKEDMDEGLRKYLAFSNDRGDRRRRINEREKALKVLALREITRYLTEQDLDQIVSSDRAAMTLELERRIQRVFDRYETGIELLSVVNPWIRPAGEAAPRFEVLAFNLADREQARADAERERLRQLTGAAGSVRAAIEIFEAIEQYDRLMKDDAAEEALAAQEQRIAQLLEGAGGEAAATLARARAYRWLKIIGADARQEEYRGRLVAYNASPRVYREFLLMDAITAVLDGATKYFFVHDDERMNVTLNIRESDESFVFEEGLGEGERVERGAR